MTLPTKKIGSLINDGEINLISGFAFKSNLFSDSKGIPLIRIRDVVRGMSDTFYTGDYDNKYIVKDGDILIGMDGNFNVSKWRGGKALLNQRVCCIRSTGNAVNESLLFYFLPIELKRIEERTPYATVKHLSIKKIKEILFPVLEEDSQTRIAEILDKAVALRQKRKESINLLDDFLRSTFLEMFGDPKINENEYTPAPLRDKGINLIGGYAFKSKDYVKEGIPLIKIGNVNKGYFDTNNISFLPVSYLKEYERYLIKNGDLTISLTGTTGKEDYGNICKVNNSFEHYLLNQRVAKIEYSEDNFSGSYLLYLFKHPAIKLNIIKLSRGIRQANISNDDILDLIVPVPPIHLQNKFSDIVHQVELLKAKYKESEKELDNLFGSLMQRAFKGEL